MKTTMLTKAMMAVLFAMTSVLTLNAVEPVKITNEEVENGRVSAKVVYEQEGTFLIRSIVLSSDTTIRDKYREEKYEMEWHGLDKLLLYGSYVHRHRSAY